MTDNFELPKSVEQYLLPVLVVFSAFLGYFAEFTLEQGVKLFLVSGLAFGLREIGQRVIAQWMEAYVEQSFEPEASVMTLIIALFSATSSWALALILPVTTSFSVKKHEQWGKGVDAMWHKREYWLAAGGIISLTLASTISLNLDLFLVAQALTVFTLSQMIPLRDLLVDGTTDGGYILLHSSFSWLILTGINIMIFALTLQ